MTSVSDTKISFWAAYEKSDAVEQAGLVVYRNPKQHRDPYQLDEELPNRETLLASGAFATSPRWNA